MKSTPEQAIYDFCNAIYKIAKIKFNNANDTLDKSKFLFECLIQLNDLKMQTGTISYYNQTIQYSLEDINYIFWLVEVPEPYEKFAFLDYFSKELTGIFYNLDLEGWSR